MSPLETILFKFSIICIFLSTGQVTDLKGHSVTQVAMGKAHTCVLTKSGEVWTFGVNNKGQCGRDTGSMSQAGKGERMDKQIHITTYCKLGAFFVLNRNALLCLVCF